MPPLDPRDVRARDLLLARADHLMRRRLALRAMQRQMLSDARAAQRRSDRPAPRP